jgi:F-type H+-transporting ATPase subunit gamma
MPLQTRVIKNKIKAVGNIRKITRAMEMVAASKMRRAIASALATREYTLLAVSLLRDLALEGQLEHPFLQEGRGSKTLMVIISSNRGLCGGFNVSLARKVTEYCVNEGGLELFDFVTVGRNSERLGRKLGGAILGSFVDLSEDLSIYDVGGLMRIVFDGYRSPEYNRVVIAYNRFVSAISYRPIIREILPVRIEALESTLAEAWRGLKTEKEEEVQQQHRAKYLFEPDETEVLEEVLPRLVEVQVYQGLLESLSSEHSARMVAMKNATDNAGKMVDNLSLSFNKARQDGITQEILEVAGGAEALNSF